MMLLFPLLSAVTVLSARIRQGVLLLAVAGSLFFSAASFAELGESEQPSKGQQLSTPENVPVSTASLDKSLQSLKRDALKLNRELLILKEELQFPANTQVGVFLSVDVGEFFSLDAVNVELDGKDISAHLYTAKQLDALKRGAIQKLHVGNVKAGSHELVAVFTGRGPKGRDYRRATSYKFDKGSSAKYLELQIVDSDRLNQPEFHVKDWD